MWLAPEVMKNWKYNESSDVYSLGVIYWEILTRQKFFGDQAFLSAIEDLVLQGRRPPVPECPINGYVNIITDCWSDAAGITTIPSSYHLFPSSHSSHVQSSDKRPTAAEVETRLKAMLQESEATVS